MPFLPSSQYKIENNWPLPYSVAVIHRAISDVFAFAAQGQAEAGRTGAVALVTGLGSQRQWEEPSYSVIGSFHIYSQAECFNQVQRKARRLTQHGQPDDVSNWPFRVPEMGYYGGAICAGPLDDRLLLALHSSVLDHADEAVLIGAAMLCQLLDMDGGEKIMSISGNHQAYELIRVMQRAALLEAGS